MNTQAGQCICCLKATESDFLAHQLRISDILSWVRNSYLTNVILLRLSHEGCTLVVLELMHMVV